MTFKTLLVALEIWQEYLLYCNATVLDMLDTVLHLCTAIIKWLSIFSYYKKNVKFLCIRSSFSKIKKSYCIYVQIYIYICVCVCVCVLAYFFGFITSLLKP